MVRIILAALAPLALIACDSGAVPNPATRREGAPAPAPVAEKVVQLSGTGLAAGPEAFYFAAGQTEVEAALARALRAALRTGANKECGAGPMTFTDFAGGLTVHFQDGRFVGWNWHGPQDGDRPATGKVTLAGTVQLGAPRSQAEAAPGYARIDGSTLGEEFSLGGTMGGFIEADAVAMLYAGTQCFFR